MAFDTFAVGLVDVEGTLFRSVRNVNENPNAALMRHHHSGRISPIYSATGQVAPGITFDTLECGVGLSLLGALGKVLTATLVYYTRRNPVKVSTGADHLKTTIAAGIAVPRTLGWSGGVNAWTLGVELCPESSDGSASPVAYGTTALPAFAAIPETFTGGKLKVNGTEVDCWQNATLDFGVTVERVYHKGLPAPVRCAVRRAVPTLRLTNLNPADRSVFGHFGTRITSAVLSLRHNDTVAGETPTRDPDANAVHTNITMVGGIVHPGATTAPEDGDDTQEIMLVFDETAAAAAIVIATNAAIAA